MGEPKFNRGCFVPMILIASVFVMSAILLLVIDLLERHAPPLIKPAPLERPVPVRSATTRTTQPTITTTMPANDAGALDRNP